MSSDYHFTLFTAFTLWSVYSASTYWQLYSSWYSKCISDTGCIVETTRNTRNLVRFQEEEESICLRLFTTQRRSNFTTGLNLLLQRLKDGEQKKWSLDGISASQALVKTSFLHSYQESWTHWSSLPSSTLVELSILLNLCNSLTCLVCSTVNFITPLTCKECGPTWKFNSNFSKDILIALKLKMAC